jgi:NADPH2:quinone reductase
MRAVVCHEFGPIENLIVEERPSPPLEPHQVRLASGACGLSFVDGLIIQGAYQIKPPLPYTPGMEVAGRIVEIGSEVTEVHVGDRVMVNLGFGGGCVDEVVVGARRVRLLPDTMTDGQAATFVQSYLTSWFALVDRARLDPGQILLVLGAGSGVGLAAVDIGRYLGLRVIATASTPDKRELAIAKGAQAVIDSSTEDVKTRAKEIASQWGAPTGVDALYDPIGGEVGTACLRALGEDGQYLVIGFVTGIPQLPANQILLRNRRVIGVDWGGWAMTHPQQDAAMLDQVFDAISRGDLSPVEPVTYPFSDAARALEDLAHRRIAGKVALVP